MDLVFRLSVDLGATGSEIAFPASSVTAEVTPGRAFLATWLDLTGR